MLLRSDTGHTYMRMRSSMYVCMYLSHVRDGSGAGAEDMHALHASAYPWNGAAPGLGGKRVHACTLTYLYTHTHLCTSKCIHIMGGKGANIDRSIGDDDGDTGGIPHEGAVCKTLHGT